MRCNYNKAELLKLSIETFKLLTSTILLKTAKFNYNAAILAP